MKTKEDNLLKSILGTDNENRNTPETTRSPAYRQADREESSLSRPFHGAKEPPVALQKETPAHRIVLLLRARGMSVRDIYAHLGGQFENGMPKSGTGMFSYQHLLTITKQAWFKKQLVSILEEAGIDAVSAESKVTHGYEKVPSEAEELDKELEKVEALIKGGRN